MSKRIEQEDAAVEIKTETVPLTLEIAKHYNRMATLKGDRDPESITGLRRVEHLRQQNVAGMFHSPEWSDVLVVDEKGKKYRVDGGSSSRMLVQAGADFPRDLYVTLRHFRAPSIKSAQALYLTFNQLWSARSKNDRIKNWAGYVSELDGMAPTVINLAISGIAYHMQLHNTVRVLGKLVPYDPLEFIEMYPEFIKWTNNLTGVRHLKKIGMMGAAFATWAFNESEAKKFWVMVRDEAGDVPPLDSSQPTRMINKLLRDVTVDKTVTWSKRAIYVKCCHAWNAWRTKKNTQLSYFKEAPLPILK